MKSTGLRAGNAYTNLKLIGGGYCKAIVDLTRNDTNEKPGNLELSMLGRDSSNL